MVLLGWVQSRESGTETRQGFGTLAGRVCVSVLVIVGTDESWLTEHGAHCSSV